MSRIFVISDYVDGSYGSQHMEIVEAWKDKTKAQKAVNELNRGNNHAALHEIELKD
ncbi:MAG TPA: hypothetical protein VNX68_13735 [Nitrosopumilaceae archaeon]|nr:hypothetical protein [Nitrosopumilaceae archaeon]